MQTHQRSRLGIVFTTVFMDLVGFGIIIPLQALLGRDLGASGWSLALVGSAYPLAQFLFSPFWGQVSDRHGRRPILLMSLAGSTLSYLGFAAAVWTRNLEWLIATRFLQGAFAANISTAQAYIADVTPPEKRAGGMALIGVAFGLGFILGPAIGGFSLKYLGASAPGLIAAAICALNLLVALWRLPESLAPEIRAANRAKAFRRYDPLNLGQLHLALAHPYLGILFVMGFLQITAFGAMEQVFALFYQAHLGLSVEDAAGKTAVSLVYVGLLSVAVQGALVRRLVPRLGERRLLIFGLGLFTLGMLFMPYGPNFTSYFFILLPMAVGRSFVDPTTSSLISRAAGAADQGRTFGTYQGLGSLARIVGPLISLRVFDAHPNLPFHLAAGLCLLVFALALLLWKRTKQISGVDAVD